MTDYRATPEQWSRLQERYLGGNDLVSAVLELRDEIEALKVNFKSTSNSSQIRSSLVDRVASKIADHDAPVELWYEDARAAILTIAEEVERRGDRGLDLDPGETADWLRREAKPITQEDFND
jgi:hypothetical protein